MKTSAICALSIPIRSRMSLAAFCAAMFAIFCALPSASAQITMTPLSSFGGGDAWLAPGEGGYAFLGTANNERGLAARNGHVYLVSRSNGTNIRLLDGATGADFGWLDTTGITGGTFTVSAAGVGGDGAIYVANLTAQSTTSPFKVYRWATEGSVPTVAYSGDGGLAGSRLGDSLAAIGSGSSTLLAAGYNSSPAVFGNNGYAIFNPTAGTGNAVGFVGTPPNAGDFRLGLTFVDSSHVIGTAGSSLYRYTSFSGGTGTLIGSPAIPDPAGATADRLMAYAIVGGKALLAVQSIGNAHVSLYDVTDPASPIYLVSGNNTSGSLTANGNGTGQLAWDVQGSTANLYAMSTNHGIQAFTVTVPIPGSGACCNGASCSITPEFDCFFPRVFQGVATACGPTGNPTTCCKANFNATGGVTVADIFAFLSAWFAGSPSADFNNSGGLPNVQDIFAYLGAWFAGCS